MMSNFDRQYWKKNYSDPMSMDGIGNAKEHVRYLKSYFAVEHVDVSTIVDLGFGYGHLFREMMRAFIPHTAVGIEPSEYAFKKAKPDKWRPVESTDLKLIQEDLLSWCRKKRRPTTFDLGICTSVFQYLKTADLEEILPILSQRIRFLYLTVPTNVELKRQIEELEFKDEYAIHRTREEYKKLIFPHFTFISSRILESKHFYNEETTPFTDLLYRF
jgi:trans-aconitate methyltransferase